MTDRPDTGTLTIGGLAALAGVSVRTLHHYDTIGLLSPGSRTSGGYRAYSAADAARLQRILFYRELELPLDRIAELIDDPAVDELDHLRQQLTELEGRIERLRRVRDAAKTTMEAHRMSTKLTPAELLEVFGDHDPSRYEDEVQQRWGGTDAYRESRARTARHSKDDWLRIKAEQDAIGAAFVAALEAGEPAGGAVAMALAERARLQIDEAYYPLSPTMHRGLADMYLADPRFTATYEAQAAGLAQYVHDAIHANSDRHDAG